MCRLCLLINFIFLFNSENVSFNHCTVKYEISDFRFCIFHFNFHCFHYSNRRAAMDNSDLFREDFVLLKRYYSNILLNDICFFNFETEFTKNRTLNLDPDLFYSGSGSGEQIYLIRITWYNINIFDNHTLEKTFKLYILAWGIYYQF